MVWFLLREGAGLRGAAAHLKMLPLHLQSALHFHHAELLAAFLCRTRGRGQRSLKVEVNGGKYERRGGLLKGLARAAGRP